MRAIPRSAGVCAALAAAATAGLVACAVGPRKMEYQLEGAHLTTPDGLHRLKHWYFRNAYVRPGADLARYREVIIDPVSVAYKRPRSPARQASGRVERGTYALSAMAMESLKQKLHETLASEVRKSKVFAVTQQPAPDAIRIRAHIIDLVIYSPPYSGRANASTLFLTVRGMFILILDIRDSKTGEPLLRVGGRAAIKYDGPRAFYPSNHVSTAAAVRRLFHRTATRLRASLEAVHANAEIPPAPQTVPTSN